MRFITFKFGALVAALCAVITFSLWPQAAQSEARSVSDRHLKANYGQGSVLGGKQIVHFTLSDSSMTAADGYFCPMIEQVNGNGEQTPASIQGKCYIPSGYGVRFHQLSHVVFQILSDNTEECRWSIVYADALADDNESSIVDAIGGGDGFSYLRPADNGTSTVGKGDIGDSPVMLDPTDTSSTWWAANVEENPGGTCTDLRMVSFTIVFEYYKL